MTALPLWSGKIIKPDIRRRWSCFRDTPTAALRGALRERPLLGRLFISINWLLARDYYRDERQGRTQFVCLDGTHLIRALSSDEA